MLKKNVKFIFTLFYNLFLYIILFLLLVLYLKNIKMKRDRNKEILKKYYTGQ